MIESTVATQACIGHVHLKVVDLDRAVEFYHRVLGFNLLCRTKTVAFLSAGGYYYHIGLHISGELNIPPPEFSITDLYRFAINYPMRRDLAATVKRLLDHRWFIDGAKDHTTHEAIYLHDPDFNDIELAWYRDSSYWMVLQGATEETLKAINKPLDFDSLFAELEDPDAERYLPILRTYH